MINDKIKIFGMSEYNIIWYVFNNIATVLLNLVSDSLPLIQLK